MIVALVIAYIVIGLAVAALVLRALWDDTGDRVLNGMSYVLAVAVWPLFALIGAFYLVGLVVEKVIKP